MIEDFEIANLVRARSSTGDAVALSEVAAAVGLDPDEYN